MESRPRIRLQLSSFDKRLETVSAIFFLLMWLLFLLTSLTSPSIIPTHFNASGKADGYGNKSMLFVLPFLTTVIYFGLTQLNKYPHIFNYTTTITEENAEQQYTIATRMLRFLKLSILVIFNLLIGLVYLTAMGYIHGLSSWFLPFTIILVVIPTAVGIVQSLKKK